MKARRIIKELAVGIALFAVLGFLFFRSCFTSEADWYEEIPNPLVGAWVLKEAEDTTVLRIEMSPTAISLYFNDYRERHQCPVSTVSFLGVEYVIFCGDTNVTHITDFRYSIYLYDSTLIELGEIVATGFNNDLARFPVGVFTPQQ